MRPTEWNQQIRKLIADSVIRVTGRSVEISEPVQPPDTVNAEFAYPCFELARLLKMAPAVIARHLVESMTVPSWLGSVEAEGPYINFRLVPACLAESVVTDIFERGDRFGWLETQSGRRVLVEYSSPNTNKPLHLGHFRNNVLGMAVINLLKAQGHDVIPATILNDRGIHICKAMVAYRRFAAGETPGTHGMKGDHFVGELYVRFDQEMRKAPELLEEAHAMLRDWERGDPEVRALWRRMTAWVEEGFEATYRRIGSVFQHVQHESDTYLLGREIILGGVDRGVFERRDDGSLWIDLTADGLDAKALLRSDGTSLYITQDLGVAAERFRHLDIDEAIYVVGSEQIYHFRVLFEIFRKLGYSWADRCRHLSYGMVYLPEGKMKSREGTVVDADDLMDRMRDMSLKVMHESKVSVPDDRRDSIAEAIGLGAIKYYILKFNPQKDIHFDPEQSLAFDGATGAYIQYCHARIRSVIRKASRVIRSNIRFDSLNAPEEIALLRWLLRYPGVLQSAAADLNPSRLAGYLWELARMFNVFYTNHRILDAGSTELIDARLALASAVATVVSGGLTLLGIEPVTEM
ncbi:arginine--tRNA ligase [bacterium]|nr:arginine--tRNA ligase [candidate division CSSED10-310 bacterium]